LSDNKCDKLIRLPDIINSPYNETSISVSPDGRTYYFSSNRPGGYGGKDIYRAIMDDNNNWSIIENLGPSVNTEFDEDAPFIHPDGKTLYFSSKGHNSMGGYDIFYTTNISKNEWKYPTNMGAPINTPSDDIGFVISADGNSAYFTSSKNSLTKYDIYKAILHKTIPLTLVKGTILGGQPPKPIKARIRVIDKETQQIIKYVYNPNPKTGKYLMIFPPNKNYEMLIEAEGYLPQLVNIFVPNQTYFYELYQEIFLKQIKINEKDTAIGQQIRISNIFYDIYNTAITDSILYAEEQKRKEHNDKLLKLIENIIVETDSLNLSGIQISNADEEKISKDKIMAQRYNRLIENIETAIEKTDSTFLKILDANAIYNSVTDKTFFYGVEDKDNQLTKIIIGNDTLYALPSVNTAKPLVINTPSVIQLELDTIAKIPQKKEFDFRSVPENKRRYVYINYIFYKSGKADIEKKYFSMLKNILELIKYNDDLGIEINGCADPIGDDQKNLELSKQRANNVYKYFIDNFISPRRFIVTAKGEIKSEKYEDLQQLRRTEIKLFEVK
jgi:outer membrane protein OmpA-like peptidoglycan-associated protein/YHS domain-containing protein